RAIVGKMRMDRIWLGRPPAIMAGHAPPDARRVTEPLLLHVDGPVARLRMNRPALPNAFDAGLVAEMTDALARLAADAALREGLLEGEGPSSAAGADRNWMRGMGAAGEAGNREAALALARLLRALDTLPTPTIARVQRAAFGGGVGLVACCDI